MRGMTPSQQKILVMLADGWQIGLGLRGWTVRSVSVTF